VLSAQQMAIHWVNTESLVLLRFPRGIIELVSRYFGYLFVYLYIFLYIYYFFFIIESIVSGLGRSLGGHQVPPSDSATGKCLPQSFQPPGKVQAIGFET
jgi:hypothetical protein